MGVGSKGEKYGKIERGFINGESNGVEWVILTQTEHIKTLYARPTSQSIDSELHKRPYSTPKTLDIYAEQDRGEEF